MPEKIIFADTPVEFYVSPGQQRQGVVWAQFHDEDRTFYILKYSANGEPTFVVRRVGQFGILEEQP